MDLAHAPVTREHAAHVLDRLHAGSHAPVYASVYAMVERLSPTGTVTEAFAWLTTAAAIGTATGSAGAGALVDEAGPVAAFVFAGVAGAVAVVVTSVRVGTLAPQRVALAAA